MIPTDSPQPQKRRNSCNAVSKAFCCAASGFWLAVRSEPHMRFHLIAAAVVVGMGLFFSISALAWALIALSIGMVLLTELLNTAIEITLDRLIPVPDPKVKAAKDIAASAVWVSALIASLIGCLIFAPKFIGLLA